MTLTLWLVTGLAAALALGGNLLFVRAMLGQIAQRPARPEQAPPNRISLPGVVALILSMGLMAWLLMQGAPISAVLVVPVAGMVGTGLTLMRVLGR